MTEATCARCGRPLASGDETCPGCGALTEYGAYRERHHRESWERKGRGIHPALLLGVGLLILAFLYMLVSDVTP
jgi:hypothetical protein